MAYFSNGTEAELTIDVQCYACPLNNIKNGCPIYEAHFLYNYDQQDKGQEKLKDVLDMLIPSKTQKCKIGTALKRLKLTTYTAILNDEDK
jgi:hypothetical protein